MSTTNKTLWEKLGHFVFRYFLLWLFGLIGVFVLELKLGFGWNVLMAIGLAGLYALPFMFLQPIWRFMAGVLLLTIYQFVILKYFLKTVLAYDMGGCLGAISWGGLILISSVWWQIIKSKGPKSIILLALSSVFGPALVGLTLNFLYQANKPIISLSYILLSYSVAVFTLLFFYLIDTFTKVKFVILRTFGRNPLLMYMLSSVLILVIQRKQRPDLPVIYIIFCSLAIYAVCLLVASYLNYKGMNIKI